MNKNVAQAVQIILNELNGGNRVEIANTILFTVKNDHRTLQQLFWSTMLLAQIGYAEASHDLRNDDAVELARLVKNVAVANNMDMGLRYI